MVVRGFEVYVHGKEKRLVQAAKGDRVEDLRGCTCFEKKNKEREEISRLGGESFTWPVFETN